MTVSNRELKLRGKVEDVLATDWDPIGVQGMSPKHAVSEYCSYAKGVAKMLLAGRGEEHIREYLTMLRTKHMGLDADDESDRRVARLLMNL